LETKKAINWLRERKLLDISRKNSSFVRNIFTECLAVKDEKILIIGDRGSKGKHISPILSAAYYLAAKEQKLDCELILQEPKERGELVDKDVAEKLEGMEEGSVIILNLSNKLGRMKVGKSFRKMCLKKKYRFTSTTSLGGLATDKISKIIDAINVDYKALKKKHDRIKEIMGKGKEVIVKSEKGTELYMDIRNVKAMAADGYYNQKGLGGNLPAGEVYFAPRKIEGTVIIDASSRNMHSTQLLKKDIKIVIEDGKVIDIIDSNPALLLKESIEWAKGKAKYPERVDMIGEFGIGLNPKAEILGSTIIDEKVLNTAHIGIGSNYWFGGNIKTIIHLDQVFKNPKIFVDGEVLKV
jgi:leucyl aminopeptidase (aminopeptidase T)